MNHTDIQISTVSKQGKWIIAERMVAFNKGPSNTGSLPSVPWKMIDSSRESCRQNASKNSAMVMKGKGLKKWIERRFAPSIDLGKSLPTEDR
jgi:hypothetical protein